MYKLKNILSVLLLVLVLISCAQTPVKNNSNNNLKILAKLISFEGGDKIQFAKFKVIKDLSDTLTLKRDTITVGYYNYKEPENNINYAVLNLQKYDENINIKNYFIYPNYDGKAGIQEATIEFIDFDYWEGCEKDKDNCFPLTYVRKKSDKNWFLIMPCGGTETSIIISGLNFRKELHLYHNDCPPYLDLSNLVDGQYTATMQSCGLGGTIHFSLVTK